MEELIHAMTNNNTEITKHFLFSVCNILTNGQHSPYALLPAVLRCLTHSWRLFPPELRSPTDLALELAALVNRSPASSLSTKLAGPRLRRNDVAPALDHLLQPIGEISKLGDNKQSQTKLVPAASAYRNGCCACRRPRAPTTPVPRERMPSHRRLLSPIKKKASTSHPTDENVPPGVSSTALITTSQKSNLASTHLARAKPPLSGFSSSFNIVAGYSTNNLFTPSTARESLNNVSRRNQHLKSKSRTNPALKRL
jgi:hypothetical protein